MNTERYLPTTAASPKAAQHDAAGALAVLRSTGQIALDLLRQAPRDDRHSPFVTPDRAPAYQPPPGREQDSVQEEKAANDGGHVIVETHPDQTLYLDDPISASPWRAPQNRTSLRLRTRPTPTSAVAWMSTQAATQWRRLVFADDKKRKFKADYLTRRVWLWDGTAPAASPRHLLVRRAMDGATFRFCLAKARPGASLRDLADMQQRASAGSAPARTPNARAAWHW